MYYYCPSCLWTFCKTVDAAFLIQHISRMEAQLILFQLLNCYCSFLHFKKKYTGLTLVFGGCHHFSCFYNFSQIHGSLSHIWWTHKWWMLMIVNKWVGTNLASLNPFTIMSICVYDESLIFLLKVKWVIAPRSHCVVRLDQYRRSSNTDEMWS